MAHEKQQPKFERNPSIRFRDNCDTDGQTTDDRRRTTDDRRRINFDFMVSRAKNPTFTE